MKKNLLSRVTNSLQACLLLFCLFIVKNSFSQSDGDLRSKANNAGYGAAATWQKYSSATGAWITSDVIPTATTNVLIRDGYTHTSNGTGYVAGTLTIGEGNAATATATISGGAITAVIINNPGKLSAISAPVFIGFATTVATATIASVNVTGTSFNDQGAGYTTATVTFADAPAGGTTATGTAVISGGKITGVTITNPGAGYIAIPAITITGDGTTPASYTAQVGIQSVNITNGGAGYTTAPTILFGTLFQVGNATTGRSVTVSGDVTFKNSASLLTGGGSTSITQTLVIGGNLIATTPVSFVTQVPTSTSSTTVSFTKDGTSTITGPSFVFRSISLGATTIVVPTTELNVSGNITTPNNPTGGINASNATVNINTYPIPAAITLDSCFLNGIVKNLNMNNSGGVILNQTLSITGALTQQGTIVTVRPGNTLTIPSPAAITGTFNSSNFIATDTSRVLGFTGALQIQNITSPTTFPLGQGGNYLPVTISPSNASTFTASVFTGATDNGTPSGTATADKSMLVDAIYNINRTAGTGNCTVTLGFPAALKGSGFTSINNNQLGISHYNGASWDAVTGNGDNTQNFATAVFNTFSPFRVAFNANPVVFPIKLGDITAAKVNGQAVLNWKVFTEANASRYIVERSSNGYTFNEIGSVKANGSSSYSITDAQPTAGKNFYRLRSVDKDNSYVYSKVLLVDFGKISASLNISPNPVSHGFFTVRFADMKAGKVAARLFSITGQLIMDQPIDYNGSTDNQLINLPSNISKGVYQLVITDGLNSQKASVVVQ